jgi:hypothetical protein
MNDLLPCPFCGGKAYVRRTGGHYSMVQIHCGRHSFDGCGVTGPQKMDTREGVREVYSHWNNRKTEGA